jgi:hypothetical protein
MRKAPMTYEPDWRLIQVFLSAEMRGVYYVDMDWTWTGPEARFKCECPVFLAGKRECKHIFAMRDRNVEPGAVGLLLTNPDIDPDSIIEALKGGPKSQKEFVLKHGRIEVL